MKRKKAAMNPFAPVRRIPRDPAGILQPESGACLSCVTANVLHMFGEASRPPSVAWVDQQLGRLPGQRIMDAVSMLYLLELGFTLESVGPFDSSRMLREGLGYLREFYAATWDKSLQRLFSPAWVQNRQREIATEIPRFDHFKRAGRYFERVATPSMQNLLVVASLDDRVAYTTVQSFSSAVVHAVMVHGARAYGQDTWLKLYMPSFTNPTLGDIRTDDFQAMWLPTEGITVISYRG